MRVRNQDKTILIKLDYILVIKNEIRTTNSDGFLITIGEYSSQEKALKVLNMIQKAIEYNNSHQNARIGRPYIEYNVFQMPLDSEVEENGKIL